MWMVNLRVTSNARRVALVLAVVLILSFCFCQANSKVCFKAWEVRSDGSSVGR